MKSIKLLRYPLFVMALLLMVLSACAETAETQTKNENIELGAAETVSTELNVGWGDLHIGTHDSTNLLESEFKYNISDWEPIVSYAVEGNRGNLLIEAPSHNITSGLVNGDATVNRWQVDLSQNVPLDLEVALGSGTSELNLGGLQLSSLDVTVRAGSTVVDLSGEWGNSFSGSITAGAGALTIYLPRETAVSLALTKGINSVTIGEGLTLQTDSDPAVYVNEAYTQTTDTLIELEVVGGIGSITIELKP